MTKHSRCLLPSELHFLHLNITQILHIPGLFIYLYQYLYAFHDAFFIFAIPCWSRRMNFTFNNNYMCGIRPAQLPRMSRICGIRPVSDIIYAFPSFGGAPHYNYIRLLLYKIYASSSLRCNSAINNDAHAYS